MDVRDARIRLLVALVKCAKWEDINKSFALVVLSI
jgi:hypothetical protein